MTFPEKLQMLRKERHLSQDQLATVLNVSRQSVSKWELGTDMPKVDKILLLSDFFEVSTDYLLHDDWNKNSAIIEAPETMPPQKSKRIRLFFAALLPITFFLLLYGFFHSRVIFILTMTLLPYLLPVCAIICVVNLTVKAALKKHWERYQE